MRVKLLIHRPAGQGQPDDLRDDQRKSKCWNMLKLSAISGKSPDMGYFGNLLLQSLWQPTLSWVRQLRSMCSAEVLSRRSSFNCSFFSCGDRCTNITTLYPHKYLHTHTHTHTPTHTHTHTHTPKHPHTHTHTHIHTHTHPPTHPSTYIHIHTHTHTHTPTHPHTHTPTHPHAHSTRTRTRYVMTQWQYVYKFQYLYIYIYLNIIIYIYIFAITVNDLYHEDIVHNIS